MFLFTGLILLITVKTYNFPHSVTSHFCEFIFRKFFFMSWNILDTIKK